MLLRRHPQGVGDTGGPLGLVLCLEFLTTGYYGIFFSFSHVVPSLTYSYFELDISVPPRCCFGLKHRTSAKSRDSSGSCYWQILKQHCYQDLRLQASSQFITLGGQTIRRKEKPKILTCFEATSVSCHCPYFPFSACFPILLSLRLFGPLNILLLYYHYIIYSLLYQAK